MEHKDADHDQVTLGDKFLDLLIVRVDPCQLHPEDYDKYCDDPIEKRIIDSY